VRSWRTFERPAAPWHCVLICAAAAGVGVAWAQAPAEGDAHAGHTMPMPAHSDGQAGHTMPMPATTSAEPSTTDSAGSPAGEPMKMDVGAMQRGSPPPDARDPNAYSDGQTFGALKPKMADAHSFAALRVDNLEAMRVDGRTVAAYDLEAWYGRTFDRGVLKSEGDIEGGKATDVRTELLWSHAFASFWDRQVGLRHDSGEGPARTWLAFGVEGLSPYKFELEATAYLGESGRTALRFDGSREFLITQKLILKPRLEANAYGQEDVARGIGRGLSDVMASIRLRYEIRRQIAPYVGVEWVRKYGATADLARANGQVPNDSKVVLGVRFWF
jgi:copper resistance protein B